MIDLTDLTKNYFYNKRVIINQGRKGYRFSIDAPILADFIPYSPEKSALEIGCGSGIISLLAIYKNKFKKIYCYEIQKRLSDIASLNTQENGFENRIEILNADFLKKSEDAVKKNKGKFDIIFSNPPFYKLNKGRLSADKETAIAKFEIKITIADLLKKVLSIIKPGGDLFLILAYDRLNELEKLSKKFEFNFVRKRDIVSIKGGKPERFLIQLRSNRNYPDRLIDEDPLIVYKQKNIYTDEMNYIFGLI